MKLYPSKQIKVWDEFTLKSEGITSFQLMQRAAKTCYSWITKRYHRDISIRVLCGPGNNGGDGFLIAAYLFQRGYQVSAYALEDSGSNDRKLAESYARLQGVPIYPLSDFHSIPNTLMIDALFGHGLNRPLAGELAAVVKQMNDQLATVISIDIPSGMPSEPQDSVFETFIHADSVLSFQQPKQSFFVDEYGAHIGSWEVLDIGLAQSFAGKTNVELMDENLIRAIYQEKPRFSHKGSFGNALLIGGSAQYPGAIALSTLACLASGVGRTFVATPNHCAETCKQLAPEAIYLQCCGIDHLSSSLELNAYDAVGIGPGLGMAKETQEQVLSLVKHKQRWVMDADALNTLSRNPQIIPSGEVVITPHPGEFDRLTEKHTSTGDRWHTARKLSQAKDWVIVLKGAYTAVFLPDGRQYINNSGNAGLAKGGSGDVLCGLMTGLLARGYSVEHGVLIAVYLHGRAADRLNQVKSKDAIKAQDLISVIEAIGKQWED